MTPYSPGRLRRLSRYYAAQLPWLINYATPSDLAMVPPSVQAWVRKVRAYMSLSTPVFRDTSAAATCDLLATLIQERTPLL